MLESLESHSAVKFSIGIFNVEPRLVTLLYMSQAFRL